MFDGGPEVAFVAGDDPADIVRAEVAVAAAYARAEPVSVPAGELHQPGSASPAHGDGRHHLDAVKPMLLDEAHQHRRLDGGDVDRHEWMRNDGEAALVVDRFDCVFDGHPAPDRLLEEPTDHVRLGRP